MMEAYSGLESWARRFVTVSFVDTFGSFVVRTLQVNFGKLLAAPVSIQATGVAYKVETVADYTGLPFAQPVIVF